MSRKLSRTSGLGLSVVAVILLSLLLLPIVVTAIVSFSSSGFLLPPDALTFAWYEKAWSMTPFQRGAVVSLILGIGATLFANLVSFPIALLLVRYDFRGRSTLNLLVMSPLLVPSTILGLALYVFLVTVGGGGGPLTLFAGHVMMVMPFAIRILVSSLTVFDRSLEEAAQNAGASVGRAFISIVLPILKTGVGASLLICFIMSWNDFAISLFLASPGWNPLPLVLYYHIQFEYDAVSAAVVTTIVFVSIIAMVIIDRLWGFGRIMRGDVRA